MKDSFRIDKVIKFTVILFFFTSGVGIDDEVLVKLSLIEQVTKDVNTTCISLNVKHPQTH